MLYSHLSQTTICIQNDYLFYYMGCDKGFFIYDMLVHNSGFGELDLTLLFFVFSLFFPLWCCRCYWRRTSDIKCHDAASSHAVSALRLAKRHQTRGL